MMNIKLIVYWLVAPSWRLMFRFEKVVFGGSRCLRLFIVESSNYCR